MPNVRLNLEKVNFIELETSKNQYLNVTNNFSYPSSSSYTSVFKSGSNSDISPSKGFISTLYKS